MNELKLLAEFQKILAHYNISKSGQEILDKAKLSLLVGVTATGRDTIIAELLKTGHYYHIASDTTRKPRVNNGVLETNGVEYWFRKEEEFLSDLKAGKLLEAEIIHNQQVSGISVRELAKANELQKIAITNVDLNIHTIIKAKPDVKAFMVLPPSFKEWMRRLEGRGKMSATEKTRRLKTACRIFKAGIKQNYFIFVTNDDLNAAVEQINKLSTSGLVNEADQANGRKLAKMLLHETELQLH